MPGIYRARLQVRTEVLQEPWRKHEAKLAERRPFQLNGLRCTAQTTSAEKSYSAVIRCSRLPTHVCMLSPNAMILAPSKPSP